MNVLPGGHHAPRPGDIPLEEQQLCWGCCAGGHRFAWSSQHQLSPKHAWLKLQGSQGFWPLQLIYISNFSKYVFNPVHSAIQAEEIV